MEEEFKIEIESAGDYKNKKEFNKIAKLTERQFLDLIATILDFLEKGFRESHAE